MVRLAFAFCSSYTFLADLNQRHALKGGPLASTKWYPYSPAEVSKMNTDVAGRVRNVQLPISKPLLPLFEAIINSIHAIEDAKTRDGRIEIEIFRSAENLFAESDRSYAEISGFSVRDNGIGFDEQNFEAFTTSDTTYKASRGGKGIGRFMWLAAFGHAEIESIFRLNGRMKCRTFTFCAQGTGIESAACIDSPDGKPATVVRLLGFKEKYRRNAQNDLKQLLPSLLKSFWSISSARRVQ